MAMSDFLKKNLPGYTKWKPLTEHDYATPERDFSYESYPNAIACEKNVSNGLIFLIADINRLKVYGFYGPK
jgi:hypothetical protein